MTENVAYKQVSSLMPNGARELWKRAHASGKILKSKTFPGSGRFLAGGQPSGQPAVVDLTVVMAAGSKTPGRPSVLMVESSFDKVEKRSFNPESDIL